ncbi:MAG: replication-relaxation family protein [Alphaproteobacteria bacterium]|nr:replication-relaxation family protein [Alphaproteobacteria bacterium]
MHRVGTCKSIALTARDLEVFRCLVRYRYLRSTYLHAFAGGASEKRFIERLCDLFHGGLVDRAAQQWRFANARCRPLVYEAAAKARKLLEVSAGGDPAKRTFLASAIHAQFEHSLMICQCLASIELAAQAQSDLRFIAWPEILSRAPEATRTSAYPFRLEGAGGAIIPDAVFGLEYRAEGKSAYRFFALEIDRGTMPLNRSNNSLTSYLAKLSAYRDILAGDIPKSRWGVPNLFVLTVTFSGERLSNMLQCASERGGSPRFLFKSLSEAALVKPASDLLNAPWQRAGLGPLTIAE